MSSFVLAKMSPSPQGGTSFPAIRLYLQSRIEILTRPTSEAVEAQRSCASKLANQDGCWDPALRKIACGGSGEAAMYRYLTLPWASSPAYSRTASVQREPGMATPITAVARRSVSLASAPRVWHSLRYALHFSCISDFNCYRCRSLLHLLLQRADPR